MPFYDPIRIGASGTTDTAFTVDRSLRFNDNDTAYLSRNFGTGGNRKKWTFSAWIKRGNLGDTAGEMRIFGGSTNASHIFFASNDELTWDIAAPGSSASANLNTTQVFRDVSAWFHLVCALDTDNSTADNRMRIYINGTEVTSFGIFFSIPDAALIALRAFGAPLNPKLLASAGSSPALDKSV